MTLDDTTREALITHLHPMAPKPEEDITTFEQEAREHGASEEAILSARLYSSTSAFAFEQGIAVVRVIFGDEVAEDIKGAAIERQRWLEAND